MQGLWGLSFMGFLENLLEVETRMSGRAALCHVYTPGKQAETNEFPFLPLPLPMHGLFYLPGFALLCSFDFSHSTLLL
jgi:hypothetical protein